MRQVAFARSGSNHVRLCTGLSQYQGLGQRDMPLFAALVERFLSEMHGPVLPNFKRVRMGFQEAGQAELHLIGVSLGCAGCGLRLRVGAGVSLYAAPAPQSHGAAAIRAGADDQVVA
jgi:hypothetical protein